MTPPISKAALRQAALARRAALSPEQRESFAHDLALRGVEIARRAIAHKVALYWPFGDEADCSQLAHALDYHQFVTALPVVIGAGRPLVFRKWSSRDALIEGPHGILQPAARHPEVIPDLIFVPLVAFDRRGHRLGYGAGYYDRTLQALETVKPPLTVGIAFATQEEPELPNQAHDMRLDLVLTEREIITCTGF